MTDVRVDCAMRTLGWADRTFRCAIGRSGPCAAEEKVEGDGATPVGSFAIRSVLLRRDRGLAPPASLPWRWLRPDDGWSDATDDPDYNRAVRHPHAMSAERLWREDHLYDAIVVLGHNDAPPQPGRGSAIFLHLRGDGPTEGCVAIDRDAMVLLLSELTSADRIDILFGDRAPLG